jgi:hypothetical protein
LDEATAAKQRAITADVASTITNFGAPNPSNIFRNPTGIRAASFADAPIIVTLTQDGSITTKGGGGVGIQALSGSGKITVNSFGPINTTDGFNAVGILADSGTTIGRSSGLITEAGTIVPVIPRAAATGAVEVNATNVLATGQFGVGISATAGSGGVTVNIPLGGSVTGGWQSDLIPGP